MSLSRRPVIKKSPLSKPQKRLLKESLRRMFTLEFIENNTKEELQKEEAEKVKHMVIRNALTAMSIDN